MDDQKIKDSIENVTLIHNEVCLFMKGTPDAPQCGFSMAVIKHFKNSRCKLQRNKCP